MKSESLIERMLIDSAVILFCQNYIHCIFEPRLDIGIEACKHHLREQS